jgi:hypothetical protein
MSPAEIKPGGPVVRLRFLWQRGKLSIAKRILIAEKTIPPHQELPNLPEGLDLHGFWFEVTTQNGEVLYRRFMENPLEPSAEVFDKSGQISRMDIVKEETIFDLLIPDLPEAAELHLYCNPSPISRSRPTRGAARKPFITIDLKKAGHQEKEDSDGLK